ncbi:hypothetical protein R3W88_016833 [Solanum pinnatisectum]|uniref:DUF1985 domain-containing protein n=1 Tax=Solanum pinnatisectum TaxID=50273 RepID=A0AAV9KYF9_9SOLN|nr:hypothetical protein R3W88_016833 [Solanum pinnatisectum]
MVEDGRYQKYPWGQIAFSKLMKTLRQKFTKEKKLYRLAGMPYSLNVWIYECASIINDEIAVKEANACNDVHPTTEEMAALDLPANVNTYPRRFNHKTFSNLRTFLLIIRINF